MLSDRHIQFIAIGGAIGAGLFLGSGRGIATAGPSLLLAYAVCGAVIFLMGRALGELTLAQPLRGSFSAFAERYLGRTAGFVTGWSYWANWLLVGAAEITAVGVLMRFWFPTLPQWLPALACLALIYAINMRAVRLFGEVEFWLALAKVLVILGLIVLSVVALLVPALGLAPGASVRHLWQDGGLFPRGLPGFSAALPGALFAFGGVEVIGLTAGDAADPQKSVPRAINGVVLRILIFYIGSMLAIMALAPWHTFSGDRSPFVSSLANLGVPGAADLVNAVVITAVISSCNTGLYAIGRMLASLSRRGHAPVWISSGEEGEVPRRAIFISALCLLAVVFLNWLIPEQILGFVMAAVAFLLLWIWLVIMISHLIYRRRLKPADLAGRFTLPGFPFTSYFVIAFIAVSAVLLVLDNASRLSVFAAAAWFAILVVIDRLRPVEATDFIDVPSENRE